MEKFTFHNPTKFVIGKNTIRLIGKELACYGFNKVLILAGCGSIKRIGKHSIGSQKPSFHLVQY